MEIDVKGHSGCSVEVVREGKQLFIYKTTRDKKYLKRLCLQGEKQCRASDVTWNHIRVPKVYEVRSEEEYTLIKMEYVYSKNYIEYFEHAGFEQIESFVEEIIRFVDREIERSSMKVVPQKVLLDKFYDVKSKTLSNLQDDEDVLALLSKAEYFFSSLNDMVMPIGICHGDLTFSNILFSGNNYFLIDFLDSFIESPLIDIVKIRQDSAFLWSRLMYRHTVDDTRLKIISRRIDKEVDSYFSQKYEWYSSYYKPFQLMNMLRILQYAKSEEVITFLKTNIGELIDEF